MLGTCGIAAVLVTNIVIACYVVMAWNEDADEQKHNKIQRQQLQKVD